MGTGRLRYAPPKRGHQDRRSTANPVLQAAAERVRVARTMAIVRSNDETATELSDALKAYVKAKEGRSP